MEWNRMMDYENVYNLRIAWSVWVAESGNKYLTEYHLRQIAKLYQIPWKTASYVLRSLCDSGDMICKDECWELSERCRTEIMAAQYLACCSQRVLSSFKCSHQIRLDGNIFLSCEQMHAIQTNINSINMCKNLLTRGMYNANITSSKPERHQTVIFGFLSRKEQQNGHST